MAGLYIHIPFCVRSCKYCDFTKVVRADFSNQNRFVSALQQELQLYANRFDRFQTIYLGGGTPSLLHDELFAKMVEAIHQNFLIESGDNFEFTVEVNPDDVTLEKLLLYKSLSVTRLSLGVQSFSNDDLKFLGRVHDADQVVDALRIIAQAGFDNVSIDLIFALPTQSLKSWEENLAMAESFFPAHLSCYNLTYKAKTSLSINRKRGLVFPHPRETEGKFFTLTSKWLTEKGFDHYEISNFARGSAFVAKHNQAYWDGKPYLGAGPAAHSFQNHERWWNVASLEKYASCLEAKQLPIAGGEVLTEDQQLMESLLLGLRQRKGLAKNALPNINDYAPRLFMLANEGLIAETEDTIFPTTKGFLVADELAAYLIR